MEKMGNDIYSVAGTAMLAFIKARGVFEVEGSKITIRATEGMDWDKVGELGDIIGELRPRRFSVGYREYGIEVEALDPSLQTLENLLEKLVKRLKEE